MRMSYKKGKDVKKKSKLGMVSVNLGLDKNKDVTQADIKGKFIARKKAMGGGMMRKQFGKGGGADTHVTKDGRTVKKGLYYYMNRAKKKGTSKPGKGSVTDKL
jgi:protein-disulfide isomerase-like protein with CxxC motif